MTYINVFLLQDTTNFRDEVSNAGNGGSMFRTLSSYRTSVTGQTKAIDHMHQVRSLLPVHKGKLLVMILHSYYTAKPAAVQTILLFTLKIRGLLERVPSNII